MRQNASTSGQLKIVTVRNRGVGLGTTILLTQEYQFKVMEQVQRLTVVINNDSKVESVTVSSGGSGYTFGTVDLESNGGVPTGSTKPVFNVIIPPNGGHGYDVYRELECF